MATRKKNARTNSNEETAALELTAQEKFESENSFDYTKSCMIQYGKQTIENRAVPDYRDGLIPVQRRILYAMYKHRLGYVEGSGVVKAAKVVGTVLGNYHPHGDNSCYEAMVTLVQAPAKFIEGSGNWGSYDDPDSPAAYRYCVTGDTLIRTNKGLIRADELGAEDGKYKNGYQETLTDISTTSLNGETLPVSHWINSGYQNVVKVEVETGSNITCTPNHPLLVITPDLSYTWKNAGDLVPGDYVCMNRDTDLLKHVETKTISKSQAAYLGYLVAEASLTRNDLTINGAYRSVNDDLRFLMSKCVPKNVNVKEYLHEPHGWGKRKVRTFRICNTAYISSLETDYGLKTGNSYDRRVPTVLWSSPTSVVAEFLSAYFEGDGSITLTSSNTINIAAHSVSKDLLQDLKLLLWEHFGILTSKILREKSGEDENGLKIYLMGYEAAHKFIKHIGFRSKRKQKICKAALKLIDSKASFSGNSKTDIIPYAQDYGLHKTTAGFCRGYDRKDVCYANLADGIKTNVKLVKKANYFYAKVVSVTKQEDKQWVYDVTVPKSHAFTANGFVVHNTQCRMSALAKAVFFEGYLPKAHDLIANFDASDVEPVVLHCNIPVGLVLGKVSGIAVALATNAPAFTLDSVAKLTKLALSGKKITPKMCKEHLVFTSPWGKGTLHSKHYSDGSFDSVMTKGSGNLSFLPDYVHDAKAHTVTITGLPLNLKYETAVEKTQNAGYPISDGTSVDSTGLEIVISLKKNRSYVPDKNDLAKVLSIWTGRTFVTNIAVTDRQLTEEALYKGAEALDIAVIPEIGVADLLNKWAAYRLELEVRLANLEKTDLQEQVDRLDLIMLARQNIDTIHEAWTVDDPVQYLADELEITVEQSKYIFSLTIMRLTKIDISETKAKIKELKSKIKECNVRIKNPTTNAVACVDNILTKFGGLK